MVMMIVLRPGPNPIHSTCVRAGVPFLQDERVDANMEERIGCELPAQADELG